MKTAAFVGIDTSCYTTSLAVSNIAGDILLNKRIMLPVGKDDKGLRQSDAVFLHIKNIQELMRENNLGSMGPIKAVAASTSPRPQEGSYMPVFQVSKSIAATISSAADAIFFETTHQHAHIHAALLGKDIKAPFLAVHLSGGTSEILKVEEKTGEQLNITIVGRTLDIPAGQLVDRIGNKLGFPFPCGPSVEDCAKEGPDILKFKTSVKEADFHFSGVEAQAMRVLAAGEKKEDVCFAAQKAIADTVSMALAAACVKAGIEKVLLFGGVISNEFIKKEIKNNAACGNLDIYFAGRAYSADNAAGLAVWAANRYLSMTDKPD